MNSTATKDLNTALRYLRMDREHSGLRWVSERAKHKKDPDLFVALERAYVFGATAVYFRFFPDEQKRPPKPQVYIYAYENLDEAKSRAPDIHRQLWNAGVVPFCFIYGPSEIHIFNCSKIPSADNDGNFKTSPHETINLAGNFQKQLDKYSASKFDSGLFWDSETGKGFKYDKSAYAQLLKQLRTAKNNVIHRAGKKYASLVKKLLMMLILIKYLEERKDEKGQSALNPEDFYAQFNPKNPSLSGVLQDANDLISVLGTLSTEKHFNGQIFQLSDSEKKQIKKLDLSNFRAFVEGDIELFSSSHKEGAIGQMTIWRLYSFNYLPIELISHIYEDFLEGDDGSRKSGVVYTPPYLVQFLVDRCMPLSGYEKENFKVLDPACGSGIFLVGALKRMIQWWRIRNDWKHPGKDDIEALKMLLTKNIYGCDIEEEAVRLTYFSLSLALLDALSPREIWGNVHFDNLIGKNLFDNDFFENIDKRTLPGDFNFVIGNPPFESKLTNHAAKVEKDVKAENPNRPDVPDRQIALLFLEQALRLLGEKGQCCLLLSSGPLLYNTKVHEFKRHLFETYRFREIYDFTPLRSRLFKSSSSSAKPAALAVLTENTKPSDDPVYHLIFRNTRASGEKIEFEIDHYDIHPVPYKAALEVPKVWQANFMGGGRLHELVEKVTSMPSLNDYISRMVAERGWKIGEGWIEAPNQESLRRIQVLELKVNKTPHETTELKKLQEKHSAEWITGKPFVETKEFTAEGIRKISKTSIKYFTRSRASIKEIFEPPHLLLKETTNAKKIPIEYSENYLTFRDKIIGISGTESEAKELKKIEKRFKNKRVYAALLWILSGQIVTTREGVVLKDDILSLPYPEQELKFNEIEQVFLDDILDHYAEFRLKGERSKILSQAGEKDLQSFGNYYCRILNSIYKDFQPVKPVIGKEFIAYPFILGNKPEIELPDSIDDMEKTLANLIDHQAGYNLWIRRIIRVYHKNVIILYKPNQKRYWLRSIAIRDADETFLDLYKQGK